MIGGGRERTALHTHVCVCVCVLYVCMQMCMCSCVFTVYMSCIGILYPVPISIPTVIQGKFGVWLKSGRFKLCTEQNRA